MECSIRHLTAVDLTYLLLQKVWYAIHQGISNNLLVNKLRCIAVVNDHLDATHTHVRARYVGHNDEDSQQEDARDD